MRRGGGLLALVLVGCTFETSSGEPQALGDGETSGSVAGTSGGGTSGELPAGTTSSATSDSEPNPTNDAGSSGSAVSSTSSSSGAAEVTTGGDSSGTSGDRVDCTVPITLTHTVADAEVFAPMQTGTFQGTAYAFSLVEGEGAARFTFDVACPSTYRLFGRVRDDSEGTNLCCDPDSFYVEGPNELLHTWFYGCDTAQAGWTWARVEAGEAAANCGEAVGVMVALPAGTHEFTLRNREPAYGAAHAGIAALVLTNDPDYTP